jgi:hypothetical protein
MARKGLWPTPTAGDGKSAGSRNLEGSKAHPGVSLTDAVQYGNSTTPRWSTPTVRDAGTELKVTRGAGSQAKGNEKIRPLLLQVLDEARRWPTPQARDWKSGATLQDYGNSRPLSEAVSGQLNPTWVEWLMGFPSGFTDCGPSATASSPRSPSTLVADYWRDEDW